MGIVQQQQRPFASLQDAEIFVHGCGVAHRGPERVRQDQDAGSSLREPAEIRGVAMPKSLDRQPRKTRRLRHAVVGGFIHDDGLRLTRQRGNHDVIRRVAAAEDDGGFLVLEPRELFFGIAVVPGVALVVGGTPAPMRTGIAVGVMSAFFVAVFGSLNKRFIHQGDALCITGLEMGAGAVFLGVISLLLPISEHAFVLPSRHDTILLLILALGCTLLPFALSLVALRHLTAFTTALAVNMEPVYAILLAMIFFGEQRELSGSFYLGVAIVFLIVFSHPLIGARPART